MREKRELEAEMTSYLGITPAYAGKTAFGSFLCSINQDHPRICGKNPAKITRMLTAPGSPPHVREKHVNECIHTILNGITPASAGKTLRPAIIFVRYQDHPRVCGKNRGIVQLVDVSTGSPPRLREK